MKVPAVARLGDAPPLASPAPMSVAARVAFVVFTAALFGFLAADTGYLLALRPAGVVFLWPPAGLVVAALLLVPARDRAAVLVGAFAGNIAADASHGAGIGLAVAGSAVNAVEQVLAALVVARVGGAGAGFHTLRKLGGVILAAVGVTALTALAGAMVVGHYSVHARYWVAWLGWWTGDGLGILVLVPLVTAWAGVARGELTRPAPRWVSEAVAFIVTIVAAAVVLLAGGADPAVTLSPYSLLPLLILAGIRYGPVGSATASFAVTVVTAIEASRSVTLFGGGIGAGSHQLLTAYTFLGLVTISALLPAVVLAERERAERRSRENEELFRQIADNVNEAFFVADVATRRTLYVSARWAEIWGRPVDDGDVPGSWLNAVHPADQPSLIANMDANARGEATESHFRVRRPDGSERWVHGRSFPVRNRAGAVYRVVGLAADVTAMREYEQRSLQAQRVEAVGLLAGGVAHDFNNLLTVVFGEVDQLRRSGSLSDADRGSLEELARAADSAAALTRQLLAFSRRQPAQASVFDLNDAVTDTARMLRRLIGEHIRLVVTAAPTRLAVCADRGQVEQLLTNLAVNGRDAMPGGGALTVETATVSSLAAVPGADVAAAAAAPPPGGCWAILAVRDVGTGIAPEVLPRIFEPFFTTKDVGRGTGLGLATCQTIVARAGGHLLVETEIGHGTTFRACFPVAAEPEAATTDDLARADAVPRGTETVMIVEDQTGVRKAAARVLRSAGYQVVEARDGDDALRRISDPGARVDLLLTDVVLPTISGPELADLVRAMRPTMKMLFTSGYTGEWPVGIDHVEGTARLVPKPFTPDDLTRSVREALDARDGG
ncbi:MAG: MASE1 domain-containing protein [Gemmatimonadota bacterium]|nr:MASE1 domain-containing protein [Gemmatimonadota bacterium]